ncbi:Lrp/AsnC ligand binding domain-containing protein [Bradyrhizobium sp. 33ap4]|uniref:Lrp/AsnC ligand binding domain-containing protein n=1 Tax=Bradyrhizobium sp. 33ap4 TaxID=3061630 RepID=UPI00292DD0FA|nr:Lrp/AsnC ligand binding domain-containing protein [Bradyrhizobium sp. 33ap4]
MCAVAPLDGWLEDFRRAIADIPEILEASRLTGKADCLLRLVVPPVEVDDAAYKKLIACLDFADVSSFTSMEKLR